MFEKERKFDKVYENIIKESAEEIEKIRTKAKRKIWATRFRVCLEILVIIFAVFIFWLTADDILADIQSVRRVSMELIIVLKIIQMLIVVAYPGSIILGIYYIYKTIIKYEDAIPLIRKKYAQIYKELVIEPMLKSLDANITYDSDGRLPSGIYEESEFGDYLVFAEDVMYGSLKKDCKFIIADIATISDENVGIKYDTMLSQASDYASYLSEPKNKKERVNPQRQDFFEGVFVRFELPKAFETELYLRKDANDKGLFNKTIGVIKPFENFRVPLDYSNFEKLFDVYAYDKVKATQIFTTDVMYELVNFYNEMKIEYEITIKENFVYLRFWNSGAFEPPAMTNFSLDKDTLYSYYELLNFVFELINKLLKIISENSI